MMRQYFTNQSGGNSPFWSLVLPSWAAPPSAARRRSSGRIPRLAIRRMGGGGTRSAVRAK